MSESEDNLVTGSDEDQVEPDEEPDDEAADRERIHEPPAADV
jgi:hypothetical protein